MYFKILGEAQMSVLGKAQGILAEHILQSVYADNVEKEGRHVL